MSTMVYRGMWKGFEKYSTYRNDFSEEIWNK